MAMRRDGCEWEGGLAIECLAMVSELFWSFGRAEHPIISARAQ